LIKIRTLRGKILTTFLGSLLVGILITIIISTVAVISFSQNAADDSADTILEEELQNLNRLANDKSILIEEFFAQIAGEFVLLKSFASDLFNNRMNVSELPSYYGDIDLDPNIPPNLKYDDKYDRIASYDASVWYVPGITSLSQVDINTMNLVNSSSNLDYVFKTLIAANPAYSSIYMGFDSSGLFRIFPYKSLTHYPTLQYTDARTGNTKIGYDPRARPWYVESILEDVVSFSTPYLDASGLGLLITATIPIRTDDGTLLGVIGADLTITTIQNSILGAKVLDHGYAYMIDFEGNTIVHQDINRELPAQSIMDLEFTELNQKEISEFNTQILNNMKVSQVGDTSYIKNGEKWFISYAPIPSAQFSIALVVPEGDILAPSEKIRNDIAIALVFQLLIFLVILALISAGIFYFTNYTSEQIVKPIQELTEVTNLIATGNLRRDLASQVTGTKEINLLYTTFRGLVTALRFGNDDYYAGNIDRAMENYLAAFELFTSLNNRKGIGICYNNLGNIHRVRGNLKDANQSYLDAITIALASRMNNLALLYLAIEEHDRAEKMLKKALEYDQMIDNARGFATRYGNLGQVYLAQNLIKEAKKAFDEAYEIGKSRQSERAVAHATMNYGVYERALGNHDNAIEYFLKAIELAKDLDVRIATSSLKNVQEIYEEQGKLDLAGEIEEQLKSAGRVRQTKEVTFVLDYSGSMSGRRIKAAVNGMEKIFKDQVNPQDLISLILFDSSSRVLIRPTMKEGNEKPIMQMFQKLNQPHGATAYYDALGQAFEDFLARPTPNEQWIIALTDGDDNSSRYNNPETVAQQAKDSIGVNLVIIGVGNLKDQQVLEWICRSTDKGKFIDVDEGVTEAITTAFEEVSSMLSEVEVEGFTSDY
jgi:tetratricopeptide (TPR) repeat protein